MIRIRFLRSTALLLALGAATPVFAQEIVAAPSPDADRLAGEVRRLAADPKDVLALLDAGDLSARLGDTSAALAFFQRAEALDPTNPRILSGRASTLVRLERPGEALTLFQQAEARGLRVQQFASDRGWAYDLLGNPDLAQRDYRTALAAFRDDETVRRYALSLGISGDTEQAMKELDPLLRRSDRAAWRARAFILAMNGDIPGADKIATTMLPGNMGASLSPFFRRLANLTPADRAFAVHFGQLTASQARLADARLAPPLPGYAPRPKPVAVAAVAPTPVVAQQQPQPQGRDRRSRKERERDEREAKLAAIAKPAPAPVQLAAAEPDLPPPPQYIERKEVVQAIPAPTETFVPAPAPIPVPSRKPVQLASSTIPIRTLPPQRNMSEPQPETLRPRAAAPAPAKVGKEDETLASIIGGISIPADELEAVNREPAPVVVEPVREPVPEPVRVVEAKPKPVVPKPVAPAATAKPKPDPKLAAKADPKLVACDAKPAAKGKAAPKAVKCDPKLAAKTDPKAKKPDPKKPDPAKAEPARTWVQVAGGANEATLSKAWKAVVAKAPAAMKGKSAWSAPLRATNRVLAGPFKTNAEAQAFVNTLGKAGVSAFVFSSDAGEKVTKLTIK